MRRWLVLLCLLHAIACAPARAQRYDMRADRQAMVSLASSKWRFHPGDDPSWASPSFDDSAWTLLKADASWSGQGYKGLDGFAWYRFTVDASGDTSPLAIRLPQIATNYEVFANGQKIGGCGDISPKPVASRCRPQVFALPSVSGGRPVVIAIRVWHWAGWSAFVGGGPSGAGSLGSSALIAKQNSDAEKIHRISLIPIWMLCLLYFVGSVSAFALYNWRRSEKEYLWFALTVLFESLEFGWDYLRWTHSMPIRTGDFVGDLLNSAGWLAALAFFGELLHAKRTVFYKVTVAAVLCLPVLQIAVLAAPWFLLHIAVANILGSILLLVPSLWILLLLIKRAREGFVDAILFLIPVMILYGSGLLSSGLNIAQQLGANVPNFQDFRVVTTPFPVDIGELASFLFLIGMPAILINRFARTRRVEEGYASEIEAARHVQEMLVPVEFGSIPGFTVEAEYRPARSVGGDFYQVLPDSDGGVLIIVGDVAGKGMPAAMLVAMIVGTIRTQAVVSMDPATMLQSLNDRLCGYISGGFSTCLVAHISRQGKMTLANAGHLSPYLNGRELSVAASLPLGVQTRPEYLSEKLNLSPGDRLTFVTDGIVEAANHQRELFGFERTEAISVQPAVDIINAAQIFGQNDDLTVVTAAFGV